MLKKKSLIEICYVTLNKWCACVLRNVRGMCNVQGCLTPTFFEELKFKERTLFWLNTFEGYKKNDRAYIFRCYDFKWTKKSI